MCLDIQIRRIVVDYGFSKMPNFLINTRILGFIMRVVHRPTKVNVLQGPPRPTQPNVNDFHSC